ncbi:hypothetical protein ONO57_27115, partial [Salmonella enterica subsp. enterica serovar Anatum]|nr:hypothetical protein [Salmonella enterica subsp. enterica serovar Anatum]
NLPWALKAHNEDDNGVMLTFELQSSEATRKYWPHDFTLLARFADVLEKMGATITWGDDFIACTRGELHAIDMDMNHIPDAAM